MIHLVHAADSRKLPPSSATGHVGWRERHPADASQALALQEALDVGSVSARRRPHMRATAQIVSGTFAMAPHGHSAMQMPQPLQ